ncbi:uncharacterized protein LOC117124315, partial [Anneissia japonica]|uniref:uncharacterized protein LOC117124315 n=1 Tax=Anneissia japonica TaxID=1529436 RepID=UPI001425534A
MNPLAVGRYVQLKTELIRWTSNSEHKRLSQLLTSEELGDRKPSQLLRKMYQLLGDRELEQQVMKQLLLTTLANERATILAQSKDDLDAAGLAKLADTLIKVSTQQTVATVHQQPSIDTGSLLAQINQLSQDVKSLLSDRQRNSRAPSSGRRTRSPSHTRANTSPQ